MGSRIAAHFANAGIPALLLDVVLPGNSNRNAAALTGIETAAKQKTGAFFTADAAKLVTPGNFEDNLKDIRRCDWIIEAVTENLDIKRALMAKVSILRTPGTILSTNTSGIPLAPSRRDSTASSAGIFWERTFLIHRVICISSK